MLLIRNMHVIFDINSKHLHLNRSLCLFILLLCFYVFPLFGQNMSIASFKMDEADQTANVEPTMKRDLNGDKCALIKIVTTQKNFAFDVGSLGITETEWQNSSHPGEIWLYVPNGVMKISIQHPQFGTIKDYDLGSRLKKGRTYVMVLTSDQVNTLVVDYENSQILDVNIFPSDAELFINGLKQNLDYNGHISLQLPFGMHNYRVAANNYHTEESQVIINDKENKHTLSVKLKQAFGYLNVNSTSELKGGELFIDDIRVGTLPISQFPLKSGLHRISVNQKLYLPYTETIAMTDSAIVTITPILKPNYAEYEIFVDGDKEAKIYDNGELLGTGRWKGFLEVGEHIIEAKKISHTTIKQKIKVIKDTPRKLSLSRPMPIYGSLEIKTQPSNAKVYIDGNPKEAGYTDFISSKLLIGQHRIRIEMPGFQTEELEINIREGQTERVDKKLIEYCNITLSSLPRADLYIDGTYIGKTPYSLNFPSNEYVILLRANGYDDYVDHIRLTSKTNDINIRLKQRKAPKIQKKYIKRDNFYLQVGYDFMFKSTAVGFGMNYGNLNMESNFLLSKNDEHRIEYEVYSLNVKMGGDFRIGNRFRIIPQIGAQFTFSDDLVDEFLDESYSRVSPISLILATRFEMALSSYFGLSVTPKYVCTFNDVIPPLEKYANGFGLQINATLNFSIP